LSGGDTQAPSTYNPDPSLVGYGGYTIDNNGVLHTTEMPNQAPTAGLEGTAAYYAGDNPYIGSGRGMSGEARQLLLS
jgi:hypothetical protein